LLVFIFLAASFVYVTRPVVAVSEGSWETKAPMHQARYGLGVGVVNGKIYAIGGRVGLNADPIGINEEYDPATDTWTVRSPMPTPRSGFGIAVYNNKIYCIGGLLRIQYNENTLKSTFVMTGVVEVYDPATDSWESLAMMPSQRVGVVAAVVGDEIYLVDGGSGVTEVYDPATDSWTAKAAIPVVPYGDNDWRGTCVVVDNKVYVIGVFGVLDSQVYAPSIDGWAIEPRLISSYWFVGAGATSGVNAPKRIYVLGGTTMPAWIGLEEGDVPVSVCQSYDLKTGNWTTIDSMPSGRLQVAVAVVNDMVYAIGGWLPSINNARVASAANEQYTPIGYRNVPATYAVIAVASVSAVAVGAGLIVYFKKRRRQPSPHT
jgi:hypothetical protein